MIITIVGLISFLGVIVGFVVSGGMAALSSGSEQQTAARFANMFGRAMIAGLIGALIGETLFHAPFGMGPSYGVELGWIVGVNLVFLHEAVHLLSRWCNPRATGRAVRRIAFVLWDQVNYMRHRHAGK
ncbi:MAG: hypothetical protein HZA46_18875 [Planctomycetales bacterium]|nr:hypothetical protein [Planctomycetales bacterium]